ncbi:DUF6924 domain-containing protein [Streptomyces sp. NPDC053427]|uniref:DUF6924 domain-containing protein n=1 Tax=Streptomyces sp. NPDC053427 TaxID=3365701 RepID=UPI0037D8065E
MPLAIPVGLEELTPLIRTDYADQAAWETFISHFRDNEEENPLPGVKVLDDPPDDEDGIAFAVIDDPAYANLTAEQLLELSAEGTGEEYGMLLVVDKSALASSEYPVLAIDRSEEQEDRGRAFRIVLSELVDFAGRMEIADCDFCDYADYADPDGTYRG